METYYLSLFSALAPRNHKDKVDNVVRMFLHATGPLTRNIVLAMPFIVASCSEPPATVGPCWPYDTLAGISAIDGEFPTVSQTASSPGISPIDGEFRIVSQTAALPEAVHRTLPWMANPGEDFNEGDFLHPGRPNYRLRFGGYAEDKAFVYFKQAGNPPRDCLVVFQFQADQAIVMSSTRVRGEAANIEQLKEIVD